MGVNGKIMVTGTNLDLLKKSGNDPCLSDWSRYQRNLPWWLFVTDTQEIVVILRAPCALALNLCAPDA